VFLLIYHKANFVHVTSNYQLLSSNTNISSVPSGNTVPVHAVKAYSTHS